MARKHRADTPIDPQLPLNALVERHPRLLQLLHRFGLDVCCGGGLPLEEAVRRHGLLLDDVLGALEEGLRADQDRAPGGGAARV